MSVLILKIIAMISMVIDHASSVFFHGDQFLRFIGRLSFPIYAMLIAEGYLHHKEERTEELYLKRLFILAVISELPYDAVFNHGLFIFGSSNVIFCYFIAVMTLYLASKISVVELRVVPYFFGPIAAAVIGTDYSLLGVLLVYGFVICLKIRKTSVNRYRFMVSAVIICFFIIVYKTFGYSFSPIGFKTFLTVRWHELGVLCVIPILMLYNRKNVYQSKWFSTVYHFFYPVHLTIFWLI